jgi:hypothetical protein
MKEKTKQKRDDLVSMMRFHLPSGFVLMDYFYLSSSLKNRTKAKERDVAVLHLYHKGFRPANIARLFRITPQRVDQIIKK